MTTVTVNLIGAVAPGLPRQMVVSLGEEATLRTLIEEVGRRGGEALQRSICAEGGRMPDSLLIALDGEVVDAARLDAPLAPPGRAAEVSLFLIRPIFGGQ